MRTKRCGSWFRFHEPIRGAVERMIRAITDAAVKRFRDDDHNQLGRHLDDFVSAHDFGRRSETLKGLTRYAFICAQWTIEPGRFALDPIHQMPGLNILVPPNPG